MRLIASSLAAGLIAITAVAPAFADDRRGHGRDHDRGRDRDRNDRDYRHGYRDGYRDDRRDDRRHRGGWDDGRGNHHNWRKGHYYSSRPHHSNFVVVRDYNRYRLPPPRHGQHYYRDSNTGEILLIAAATGLVLWALAQ